MSAIRPEDRDPTREPGYHRAEAEALIRACDAMRDNYASDIPWGEVQAVATLAQVHATLAGPATRILEIQGVDPRYDELRAAVREAVALSSGPVPFVPDVPAIERAWDRLRALVGGDS